MADLCQVAIVARQVLEPRIRCLDENPGVISGLAQHALNTQHFMADGIAIAKRREHLVNCDGHL